MKYNPNRNYLYPVMRPYSDDYGDALLGTNVTTQAMNGEVHITVNFEVSETSVRKQVADGKAQCSAMLYCRDTLHREMLRASPGSFRLNRSVPLNRLANHVEIHPAIITLGDIEHPTDTAHEEYEGAPVRVGKWKPLATDQTWHFEVNPNVRPVRSIFNLVPKDLPDGEFDIEIDPAQRYINITASVSTLEQFSTMRHNVDLVASTVYISALTEILSYLKTAHLDNEEINNSGWITCIRSSLKQLNIDIGSNDQDGSHSLFRAAQLLLDGPFGRLIEQGVQSDTD